MAHSHADTNDRIVNGRCLSVRFSCEPGISVNQTSGLVTTEDGGTDTFTGADYYGLDADDVSVTNQDDETPRLVARNRKEGMLQRWSITGNYQAH